MKQPKDNSYRCFIFSDLLKEVDAYPSVIYGEQVKDFQYRTILELQNLQATHTMILVLPGFSCSLIEADLPLVSEKKARIAIPYALEEAVVGPIESLHFAWEDSLYSENKYKVLVIDKALFSKIIEKSHFYGLQFDVITTEFLALDPLATVMFADRALVSLENFKGIVNLNLLTAFFMRHTAEVLVFRETKDEYLWLAENLHAPKLINLLQGEFQKETKVKKSRWLKISLYTLICSIGLWISSYLLGFMVLNNRIAKVDKIITATYTQFFPNTTVPYNIRSKIEDLLGLSANSSSVSLWKILNKVALGIKNKTCTLDKLEFQKNLFRVTINCENFASLESLEASLRKQTLKVSAKNTSSQKKGVLAILELK